MPRRTWLGLGLGAALLAWGCGGGITGAPVDHRQDAAVAADAAPGDAPAPVDAPPDLAAPADAAPDAGPDGPVDFCGGSGPIVTVGDGVHTYDACTGQLAENIFRNAVCTCNNTQLAGYLLTRAFDSSQGPYQEGVNDSGGAVGINNHYSLSAGYTDVGGSLAIAGPDSLSFVGYLQVRGDLELAANATALGYVRVRRDAYLRGDFLGLGVIDVDNDLHRQGSVNAIQVNVGGAEINEPVTVDPPCDCDPAHLLDITGLVGYAATHNDNAGIGLATDALKDVFWSAELTLPCGRYYLDEVSGLAEIIVNVQERVALFIGGDLRAGGNVEFRIAPGAEVDIFVKGNLVLVGAASFGDKDHPARTRLYVGGTGDITLVGAGGFVGNVYAPRAKVTAVGFAEVYGSVFARDFVSPGYAHIVYDRAILTAGEACDAPEPPTGSCEPCLGCTGGAACVGGVCAPCTGDGDCCGQQVCYEGGCVPLLL
ncbi:MAG TPA: collagen-binding domain-containing protein [Polyangia bacterium]|jgi:hypothetical protein